MDSDLISTKQVSGMTGLPCGTLRYYRHMDIGPASFTLGRRVVYRRADVLRWISERENATRRGGGDAATASTKTAAIEAAVEASAAGNEHAPPE